MTLRRTLRRATLVMTSTSSIVAIALALVLLASIALRYIEKPRHIHLAVSPADNADAQFADALARELPRSFLSSRVTLERADTLADVAGLVDGGTAQMGIVRTDVAMPKDAATMLVVHRDAALFLARPDAKIANLADLANKKIGVSPGSAENIALLDMILTRNGIDPEGVTHVPLAVDALADAVAKNTIEAAMVLGPLGSPYLDTAVTAMAGSDDKDAVILPVENAAALEAGLSGVSKLDIPSGLFAGSPPKPDDDVTTVAVDYQLVARLDMSEGAVDQLTRTIFQLRRALATTAPVAQFMQSAETQKGSRYALHVGATSYYQDTEKSFMDRYGDWFYILAMIGGGLGSAIASVIGSLQARSRRQAMDVLDHLADLRRRAAECSDPDGLRDLDDAVGAITLRALQRAREGLVDQAGLEILRIALDETRRAITQRMRQVSGPAIVERG